MSGVKDMKWEVHKLFSSIRRRVNKQARNLILAYKPIWSKFSRGSEARKDIATKVYALRKTRNQIQWLKMINSSR